MTKMSHALSHKKITDFFNFINFYKFFDAIFYFKNNIYLKAMMMTTKITDQFTNANV